MKMHYESSLFKLPLLRNFTAIVLGRYCFTKLSQSQFPQHVYVHEMVHQRQMNKYGIIMFYLIYLKDYVLNLIKYHGDYMAAYFKIPFEIEAYDEEINFIRNQPKL